MKSTVKRILVMPDTHEPFSDQRAVDCFLEAAYQYQPDELIIIGDYADFFGVSQHVKPPERKYMFKEEAQQSCDELDVVESLGVKKVTFCEGNHENRLTRYIARQAPELHGIVKTAKELLGVDRRPGWNWLDYGVPYRVGQIAAVHDVGRSGVNAMRASLADFGGNLIFGHTHRLGVFYDGTVDGETRVCMNVGWLGDYDSIDYMHKFKAKRSWQHGFGTVDMDENGVGFCNAIPIINGRCMIDGRTVKG